MCHCRRGWAHSRAYHNGAQIFCSGLSEDIASLGPAIGMFCGVNREAVKLLHLLRVGGHDGMNALFESGFRRGPFVCVIVVMVGHIPVPMITPILTILLTHEISV